MHLTSGQNICYFVPVFFSLFSAFTSWYTCIGNKNPTDMLPLVSSCLMQITMTVACVMLELSFVLVHLCCYGFVSAYVAIMCSMQIFFAGAERLVLWWFQQYVTCIYWYLHIGIHFTDQEPWEKKQCQIMHVVSPSLVRKRPEKKFIMAGFIRCTGIKYMLAGG